MRKPSALDSIHSSSTFLQTDLFLCSKKASVYFFFSPTAGASKHLYISHIQTNLSIFQVCGVNWRVGSEAASIHIAFGGKWVSGCASRLSLLLTKSHLCSETCSSMEGNRQRIWPLWWWVTLASELQYYLFSPLESLLGGAHCAMAAKGMLSGSCAGTCSDTNIWSLEN